MFMYRMAKEAPTELLLKFWQDKVMEYENHKAALDLFDQKHSGETLDPLEVLERKKLRTKIRNCPSNAAIQGARMKIKDGVPLEGSEIVKLEKSNSNNNKIGVERKEARAIDAKEDVVLSERQAKLLKPVREREREMQEARATLKAGGELSDRQVQLLKSYIEYKLGRAEGRAEGRAACLANLHAALEAQKSPSADALRRNGAAASRLLLTPSVGPRPGCSTGCSTFAPNGAPCSWSNPEHKLYQAPAATVAHTCRCVLLSVGLGITGGRSSLCSRQHELMTDPSLASTVRLAADAIVRKNAAELGLDCEDLFHTARTEGGCSVMGALLFAPMDATPSPDVALLVPAEFSSPITTYPKQIAAVKQMAGGRLPLPPSVSVRTDVATLRSLLSAPPLITALRSCAPCWPSDEQGQLGLLRATIEVQTDQASALSAASARTKPATSDRGNYRLGAARVVAGALPSTAEQCRLGKLWQAGARAFAAGGGSADDEGLPAAARIFLEDPSMYGKSHRSCCTFHREQRLRVLAFLHFWTMGDGSASDRELRREIEWYAACDEVA